MTRPGKAWCFAGSVIFQKGLILSPMKITKGLKMSPMFFLGLAEKICELEHFEFEVAQKRNGNLKLLVSFFLVTFFQIVKSC